MISVNASGNRTDYIGKKPELHARWDYKRMLNFIFNLFVCLLYIWMGLFFFFFFPSFCCFNWKELLKWKVKVLSNFEMSSNILKKKKKNRILLTLFELEKKKKLKAFRYSVALSSLNLWTAWGNGLFLLSCQIYCQ